MSPEITALSVAAALALAADDTTRIAEPTDTAVTRDEPTVIVYERDPEAGMTEAEIRERLFPEDSPDPVYEYEDAEGKTLSFGFFARYDRVNELSGRFTQTFKSPNPAAPRVALSEVYSTGRDRWFFRFTIEQPLLADDRLTLGISAFHETTPFTDFEGRVGDGENSLAALLFREDFRHYLAQEGFLAFLSSEVAEGIGFRVRYQDALQRGLDSSTNGSLLRPRDHFRTNPRAGGGDLRSFTVSARFRRESGGASLTHRHDLEFESAGRGLGGPFGFDRVSATARFGLRVAPQQEVVVRVRGGGVLNGNLPIQRDYFLGGIGTLRAQDFASITGERAYLANVEYGFPLIDQIQGVVFTDLGAAWRRGTPIEKTRPVLDAGFAVRNRTGRFRINVARNVRTERAPLVVTVRITQPF